MKQLLCMFLIVSSVMGMTRDIDLSKDKAPALLHKLPEIVVPPLPLPLDELVPKDRLLASVLEFYHDGNKKHLERLEDLWLYELCKASDNRDDNMVVTLSKRLHVLGTMLNCLQDVEVHVVITPNPLPDKPTNANQLLPAQTVIDRGKQTARENRVRNISSKPIKAMRLSGSGKDKYIIIGGKKKYPREGDHVKAMGIDWVAIDGRLINLDIGQAIVDAHQNCHIRGLDGQLWCLHFGKDEGIYWDNGNILLYKDKLLQIIPNITSITIDAKQPANFNEKQNSAVSSVSNDTLAYTDMVLTTPTNPDLLFRQRVTANPETNFSEYLSQVRQLLHELGSKGLYTAEQLPEFTKEVGQGIAKHLTHVVQHPVEYAQEFATATLDIAKEVIHFVLIVGAVPEGPCATQEAMQQYIQLIDQKMEALSAKYDQLCAIVPQMSRSEWADLLSKIIVDGLVAHKVGKGVSCVRNTKLPTSVFENPLLSKISTSLEGALAPQVEALTAEGVAFKASQAELAQEVGILKSTGEIRLVHKPLWYEELKLKPLGLGSTGRAAPANLHEQLVLKEIMFDPAKGDIIRLKKGMTDIRWPNEHGWEKMRYRNDEFSIEVHYVGKWENGILKAVDDFKFKEQIK